MTTQIVANVGQFCIIYRSESVDVQPALTEVEVEIMWALAARPEMNISGLAALVGCGYPWAYAMVYRLANRGLVSVEKSTGVGLVVRALAKLIEGIYE